MWPFSQKHSDLSELELTSDQWSVFTADENSEPLVVLRNDAAGKWKWHPQLSLRIGFAMPLNNPNPGGLPTPEENMQLQAIEEIIAKEVVSTFRAVHVLSITNGVMKEFVYYEVSGPDIGELHQRIRTLVPSHDVQCIGARDPKWEIYTAFGK